MKKVRSYKSTIKKLENKQNLKRNMANVGDNVTVAGKSMKRFAVKMGQLCALIVLKTKNGCIKILKGIKVLFIKIKDSIKNLKVKISEKNKTFKAKRKQNSQKRKEEKKNKKKLYIESSKPKEIIVEYAPKSYISEEFRTLRTNLQFMSTDTELKTILVTSTTQKEGKSYTSANLAATFAQTGKKVILVDADMRKGRQHEIFEIEKCPGLSNYLSGVVAVKSKKEIITKFVKETKVEGLFLLPMGNTPPNPSELISSKKLDELLEALKENFDMIIFDGTPSSIVTDSVILSRKVDTTIIVAAHNLTKADELKKVKRDIKNVGGKIAGVVINKIPTKAKVYSNSYYYEQNTKTKFKFGA